jgi:hypothetical protein
VLTLSSGTASGDAPCDRLPSSGRPGNDSSGPSPRPPPDPDLAAPSSGSSHRGSTSRGTPSPSRSPPSSDWPTGSSWWPPPSTGPGMLMPSPASPPHSSSSLPADSGTAAMSRRSITPRSNAPAGRPGAPAPHTNLPQALPTGPPPSGPTTGAARLPRVATACPARRRRPRGVARPRVGPDDGSARIDPLTRPRHDARRPASPLERRQAGQPGRTPKWGRKWSPPRRGAGSRGRGRRVRRSSRAGYGWSAPSGSSARRTGLETRRRLGWTERPALCRWTDISANLSLHLEIAIFQ